MVTLQSLRHIALSNLTTPGRSTTPRRTGALLLTGQVEATLDAKRRMTIPSMFRAGIGKHGVRLLPAPDPGTIWIFPELEFVELLAAAQPSSSHNRKGLALVQLLLHSAEFSRLDTAARILVPTSILEKQGLKPETSMLISGSGNFLEMTPSPRKAPATRIGH